MTQNFIFNYLNDYEEPVADSRLIQLEVDFNRSDGISTLKLENGAFLDDLRDGRFVDREKEDFYSRAYCYYYEQKLLTHCYVKISF